MARSDNIRADIERISAMPDDEFVEQWGEWCRQRDRDPALMRQRWLDDLGRALPHAVAEEEAVAVLIEAKAAYAADSSPGNRARKEGAIAAVQAIRAEDRVGRTSRI